MALRVAGSVGERGTNNRTDVWNVQVLLIKVRKGQGEPAIELDGRIGPETIGAIKKFQKQQFGWANPDGRVDPNGNTLKHLNLLTDKSGPAKYLLEPVTTKRQGRWEVTIGADGEIFVRPGDWLSKYSAAVDGDFYTIWPYMRPTDDGQFISIRDPKLIIAGESLYHIPTFLKFRKQHDLPEVDVPQPKVMTDSEKKKLSEEFISSNFNLRGDNAKALADALTYLDHADAALTVAEVAGLIAEGTVLAGVATAASLAAVFGSMVGGVIALLNVLETGQRLAGMRGVAYASVAWAFDDDKTDRHFPGFSRTLEQRLRYGGQVSESEVNRCKRAWADAVIATKNELEKKALGPYGYGRSMKSQKLLIGAAKKRIVLAGEGNRQELCRFIMQSFDRELKGQVLIAWQSSRNEYVYND